jgi:chemotaxis protein MotA
MNFYSIFGFIIATVVLYIGLRLSTDNMMAFYDVPSMFIVFGGTFASTAVCFQLNRFVVLFKIFLRRVVYGKKNLMPDAVKEVLLVADAFKKGDSLNEVKKKIQDPFLIEACNIIEDGIIQKNEILSIMEKRNENITYHSMEEANKIKTVSKFPPAFGMIGTTIGMIVLLGELGGEDAMKKMGPAMGVCLITTLYGAVVSNMLFIPVSENLIETSKDSFVKNKMIIEGVNLLMDKSNPILIVEKLNSYLSPTERLDWKNVVKK